jgi:hypothetical protein
VDEFSAALRGAAIMKRYDHNKLWLDGDSIDDPRLQGKNVLRVEEIQRGPTAQISDIEARANAEAIRSWAAYTRLIFDVDTLIVNDPGYDAYLVVPQEEWATVLPMLQAL